MSKPPCRHCWECGHKFHGNHWKVVEVDGLPRYVHKSYPKCNDGIDDERFDGEFDD